MFNLSKNLSLCLKKTIGSLRETLLILIFQKKEDSAHKNKYSIRTQTFSNFKISLTSKRKKMSKR